MKEILIYSTSHFGSTKIHFHDNETCKTSSPTLFRCPVRNIIETLQSGLLALKRNLRKVFEIYSNS